MPNKFPVVLVSAEQVADILQQAFSDHQHTDSTVPDYPGVPEMVRFSLTNTWPDAMKHRSLG